MNQTPDTDTIIDEIHCTRRQIAENFGYDLAAIVEDARQRQAASGRTEWRRKLANEVVIQSTTDAHSCSGQMPSPTD